MTYPSRRTAIIIGVVVLSLITLVVSQSGSVIVTTAVAESDTLSMSISTEGVTRARDRFTIAAPISGRLTRLDVKEGELVEEGQLIGRLYPAPEDPRIIATTHAEVSAAEARYQEAGARLTEAELQALQAKREVERRRPLLELGAITRERMEQAELASVVAEQRYQSATAGIASAEAALEGAHARLLGAETADDNVIPIDLVAPLAGRVLNLSDPSERVVLAGSRLLELADTDGLEVVLDVLSEDAVQVQPGNEIIIIGWGGEGLIRGQVRVVTLVGYTKVSALGVEEQRVDILADLYEIPPMLGTGYRVSGEIVIWEGSDVLVVPASALFRQGEEWGVFVVQEGRAKRRLVVIGHRNENKVEIVKGLSENEEVIVFPSEEIDDGTRIQSQSPGS